MAKKISIFYSWQSEINLSTNRELIERALRSAAQNLSESVENVEAVVDRDTAGVGGSPDIAATILSKIDASEIFVADVTLVPSGPTRKPTPNANVLIETGYAWHGHGWPQIILVQNLETGRPEELPFDLRKHKVVTYSPVGKPLAVVEASLAVELEEAIKLILPTLPPKTLAPQELTSLKESVEQARGDRRARGNAFSKWFVGQIDAVAPDINISRTEAAKALDIALPETIPAVTAFGQAASLVASFGDAEATKGMYEGLADLVERMDPSGQTHTFLDYFGEFHAFVGHEVLAMLVGQLLEHQQYGILEQLLPRPMKPGMTQIRRFPYIPEAFTSRSILLDEVLSQGPQRRISIRTDRLKQRHTEGPLAVTCDLRIISKGDFLLFLKTSMRNPSGPIWWPWLSGWNPTLKEFTHLLRSKEHLAGLQRIIGLPDTAQFVEALRSNSLPQFNGLWRTGGNWPIDIIDPRDFGVEP